MINFIGLVLAAYASHYSDGIMQDVLHNRQTGQAWVSLPLDLPAYDGLIAVRDCAYLGEIWTIRPVGFPSWERHLVVDCARPAWYDGAREWMDANHIMVEVSFTTAERWGSVGKLAGIERLYGLEDLRYGTEKD